MNNGICCHDLCPIKEGFLQVPGNRIIQLAQGLFRFLLQRTDTFVDNHTPIHCGLSVASDSLAVNKDGTIGTQPTHILRKHQIPAVKYAFILPVVFNILQIDFLSFLTQEEGVKRPVADGVHFLLNNTGSTIGVQDAAARFKANAANQQFMILNVDLLTLTLILVASCLLDDPGLTFRVLEALCDILCIVDVHVHSRCQVLLPQRFNTLHIRFCHWVPPPILYGLL